MKYIFTISLLMLGSLLFSEVIWQDGFETNTGWILTGEFELGSPQGLGGNYGNPDPQSAYAGFSVLGVDLDGSGDYPGDYEHELGDREVSAISPAIDCASFIDVELKFQRWLNVEQSAYDHAYIDISNDNGISWIEIWTNDVTITDNAWNEYSYDISQFADLQSDVRVRFSIGETDGSWQYCGWNLDELQITGTDVEYGTIAGNVIDSDSGQAIAFAQVMSEFGSTVSDEFGDFILSDIPEGVRDISVFALGYLDYTQQNITVLPQDTTFVVCELDPDPNIPPSPLNLQANLIDSDVELSWEYPYNEDLLAYNVYRDGVVIQSVLTEFYLDTGLIAGNYSYFVTAVHEYGESLPSDTVLVEITEAEDEEILAAEHIELQNYPNPFNPETAISFSLTAKHAKDAKVEIFNLKGQKIHTLPVTQSEIEETIVNDGSHPERIRRMTIIWNGTDENNKPVPSGIYLYKLNLNGRTQAVNKMLLLK